MLLVRFALLAALAGGSAAAPQEDPGQPLRRATAQAAPGGGVSASEGTGATAPASQASEEPLGAPAVRQEGDAAQPPPRNGSLHAAMRTITLVILAITAAVLTISGAALVLPVAGALVLLLVVAPLSLLRRKRR